MGHTPYSSTRVVWLDTIYQKVWVQVIKTVIVYCRKSRALSKLGSDANLRNQRTYFYHKRYI